MIPYILKLFPKKTLYLNYVLLGLYVYYLGHLFYYYLFAEEKWTRVFNLIGVCLVLFGFINIKKAINRCDRGFLLVYYIFMTVCVVNVIIGIPQMINEGRTAEMITNPQSMWMFLVGFAFIIPVTHIYIKQIIKWALLYAFTSLLFSLFYFRDLFIDASQLVQSGVWDAFILGRPQEPVFLLVPIAAFFMFFNFFPLKWRILIIVSVLMAILAAAMSGRRYVSLILIGYIIIALYIYLIKRKSRWIRFIVLFSFVLFFITLLLSTQHSVGNFFDNNLVVLSNRINDDTRSDVETDFYKDMKDPSDFFWGRGMAGTYVSPLLSDIDHLHRRVVETGYLNIILHGGLLMLVPYVYILLYAFFIGFFYSKNLFVKNCALFIIYHLLLLYPGGHTKLTLEFFILFLFIRICLTRRWRNMDNLVIKQTLAKSIMS